jgi:hypothetical protein
MLSRTSVTREANTVRLNFAYERLLKRFKFLSGFAMLLPWLLLPARAAGQVSFVQVNSSNAVIINRSTLDVPFTSAQAAGNLNVVVVGWNDTSSSIASVTDSNGNTYAVAATTESTPVPAPPAQQFASQAIYYAKNIIAGANTVTITFNQNTAAQSVRIVEYAGLDTVHPLDTSVGATGSAATADSGAVTTNSANDLLFGAGSITTGFTGSGTGFTTRLLNGFGDIVEDQVVTTAASYNATATLGSGSWVMQLVAFRAAAQTAPTFGAPAISSLSTSSGPEAGGSPLTLTGTNFEPGAAVLFSNSAPTIAAGVNCSVVSNTTITCLTPSLPSGAANITVTNVDDQVSAPSAFTFSTSTPFATAVSPNMTPDTGTTNGGTVVAIFGSDFAAGASVTFGGLLADRIAVLNVNTILASLPAGRAGLAAVLVTNPSGTNGTLPGGYTYAPGAGINFVQVNSAQPASPATTTTVTYPVAQTAGNLNIVVVGWADATSTVTSVVDSAGNTYAPKVVGNVGSGLSQSIYFAKNIAAAGSNTVTVTFNTAAASPNVRILEYSGADTANPVDDTSGQIATGTLLDSGTVFTTVAGDLVIGASMSGGTVVTARPTYTTVTNTTPGGISVEHLVGPAAGSIRATAIQNSSTPWIMQAVAFKQAGAVPDFTISVTPPTSATVVAGNPATYTISVSPTNGFNSAVTLTCSGLPLGASCAFAPPAVTPSGTAVTSTLTITTAAATPVATSTVTVTGTFGSLSHDTTVSLSVTDFTIAASTLSPATVAAGGTATSTVTIAALNSFTGATALTCSVAPVVAHAPSCAFNPASVPGGAGTSVLTVSTSATTPANAYTVTVGGTSGSASHNTSVSLTVTAAIVPDFGMAVSALAPASVAPGASATSTITITPANGFNAAVALTCSVAPAATRGPTCGFNPASVAGGSGTSTLMVSTTAATTASLAPHATGLFYAMLLPIGGLAILGTGITSRRKKLWGFLLGCLLFSSLIILPACGGGSSSGGGGNGGGGHPGTPAGTYTVTVTGTSGSLTHTATASVTVQ